jgi:LCP family protein required for cell wall assembly
MVHGPPPPQEPPSPDEPSGASGGRIVRFAREVRRSALLAAVLSGLVPGLGQLWVGSARRALIVALPVGLAIGAVVAVALTSDRSALLGALLSPEALTTFLAANALLLVYRVLATVDAYRLARQRWGGPGPILRGASIVGLAALVAVTGIEHAVPAALARETYDAVTAVFAPEEPPPPGEAVLPDDDFGDAQPTPSPLEGTVPLEAPAEGSTIEPPIAGIPSAAALLTPPPTPAPTVTPGNVPAWASDGRLDLLLIGTDAGPDRWKLRTDTMILLSVDVRSGRAALFGFPRNLVNVPLPRETAGAFACRCWPGLLNALWVYADSHPARFPGGDRRGFRAVAGAIHELSGARIDGLAVVDMNGFVDTIDVLGGLRIRVPEAIHDRMYPRPDGSGLMVLDIAAGLQTMDGFTALAYARSRHQDSDYGRMRRQQQVLLALGAQLKPCRLMGRLPSLLPIVRKSVWTTIRSKDLPGLLELAARVDVHRIKRVAFTPSTYPAHLRPGDATHIRRVVANVFGDPADEEPLETLPEGPC